MSQTTTVGHATSTGLDSPKLGMWIFLVSEVMLFSALIGGFLQMKGRSPADAHHVLNVPITAVNTFILIVSSTTVVLALQAIMNGDQAPAETDSSPRPSHWVARSWAYRSPSMPI